MKFWWSFGRDDSRGWRDAIDDSMPARLQALASSEAEIADRVSRRRGAVLTEFTARQMAPVTSSPWRPRRLAFAMVTATLLLALTAGGLAASGPGLPAYPIRLAVEEMLLPAGAPARLEGQLGRLERRLAEATRASDPNAISAALAAYEQIAAEVVAMSPPTGSDDIHVEDRVNEHLRRLQRIGNVGDGRGARAAERSANGLLTWLGGGNHDRPTPGQSLSPSMSGTDASPSRSTPRSPQHSPGRQGSP